MTASQLSVNSESCVAVSGVGGLTLVTRSNRAPSIVTATCCASASKNCALSGNPLANKPIVGEGGIERSWSRSND